MPIGTLILPEVVVNSETGSCACRPRRCPTTPLRRYPDGTPNPRAVIRYLLKHPLAIPRMAKLAKGAKLATERAAEAAIAAVSAS